MAHSAPRAEQISYKMLCWLNFLSLRINNHHGIEIVLIFLLDIFTHQFAVPCNFAPKVVTYFAVMDGLPLGTNILDEHAVFLFLINLFSVKMSYIIADY